MPGKSNDPEMIEKSKALARLLKERREQKRLKQSDLSERSKVSLDTLRSIENGRSRAPGFFLTSALIHALDGNVEHWLAEIEKRKLKKNESKT